MNVIYAIMKNGAGIFTMVELCVGELYSKVTSTLTSLFTSGR